MNSQELVLAVMAEVQGVAKREKNIAQNFNFRGIDAVMNAVGPALRKHGGYLTQSIISVDYSTMASKNGGSLNIVRGIVQFNIFGSEGDPVTGDVAAESFDSGDKATAKMMSVALRTFLLQALALPTDEPDPDLAIYELGEQSGAPTVAELKAKIAGHFIGKPKTAITEALEDHTGKKANWSLDELAGYLDALEGSK
jgi:hypothetical protein|tara:strand:+ start:174 stop:764 length:591 start_codon:yes stop_codon:yes gene_type:complete